MWQPSFRVHLFFLLYVYGTVAQPQPRQQGDVCLFAGQIFQPGESYGELFEIPRCGNWFDFPCFCNLNFDPPIDCPYCGLLTQNGEFVCAKEDERVSIVNGQGIAKNCACLRRTPDSLADSYLEAICIDAPAPIPRPPTNPPTRIQTSPPTIETNSPTVTIITNTPTVKETLPDNPNQAPVTVTPVPITPAPTTRPPITPAPTTAAPVRTPEPTIEPTASPVDPNDVCVIDVDGISQTFLNGQSFGTALLTRCIDAVEYPCFCDTSLDVKIRCPYCGYLTVTGELACARLDETIQFNDRSNTPTECTCLDDVSLASNCRDLSAPTPEPTWTIPSMTAEPTVSPMTIPDDPTTRAPTSKPSPIIGTLQPSISNAPSVAPAPVTPWPTFGIDKPAISDPIRQPIAQPSTPKPSPDGCFFNRKEDESIGFVQNGFPFGSDVAGPCPAEDFPVICNTRLTGKREYPYCVFSSASKDSDISINNGRSGIQKVCARSGSRVLITRPTDGLRELCSCLYNNPAIGPVSQCKMVDFNYTEILTTREPTMSPTITTLGNNLGVDDPIDDPLTSAASAQWWIMAMMSCTFAIFLLLDDN